MHKFLTESREVVVMVMPKYAEFILGEILCQGGESVKRQKLQNDLCWTPNHYTSESADSLLTIFRFRL
jgi:hypothetical protein